MDSRRLAPRSGVWPKDGPNNPSLPAKIKGPGKAGLFVLGLHKDFKAYEVRPETGAVGRSNDEMLKQTLTHFRHIAIKRGVFYYRKTLKRHFAAQGSPLKVAGSPPAGT